MYDPKQKMRNSYLCLIVLQCTLFFAYLGSAIEINHPSHDIEFCMGCNPEDQQLSMSPPFATLYEEISSAVESHRSKRDATLDLLQSVLLSLNNSGVVIQVLHQIADSPQEMNTLSNYIFQVLVSLLTGKAIKGLNVTVNATQIIDSVNQSGIILSTLSSLLLDDLQLAKFAANVGETMVNNTWIPEVVYTFGDTGHLSFQTIFNLARNSRSKDPGFNGTTYTPLELLKRDSNQYDGSLQSFINNMIGSGLTSSLFLDSLESILEAVKNSGVIISLVQTAVADPKIQYMGGFIANKLYNYGVFDQIPLDKYIQKFKKDGTLKKQTQFILTDPLWLPVVAKIFLQWYNLGVNDQVRRNMYGP